MTRVEATIKEYLEKNNWGCGEYTEAFVVALNELAFLNFLYNVIPPNEMEQYITMYNSKGEKENGKDSET